MLNSYNLINIRWLCVMNSPTANLFYRHDDLYGVQAVESQVVGEVGGLLNLSSSSDFFAGELTQRLIASDRVPLKRPGPVAT
jgi:hypothetical protein